jgi:hypothetical protein
MTDHLRIQPQHEATSLLLGLEGVDPLLKILNLIAIDVVP